jgi:hypothetical protein
MRLRIPPALAGAALALAVGGCALLAPAVPVRIGIPRPPAAWLHAFPDLRFRLAYVDAGGRGATLDVVEWWLPVAVPCAKTGNAPVLAYPLPSAHADPGAPGGLRPAGGVWPGSAAAGADGEVLELSWEDGALASLLFRLRAAGLDVSLLNAGRLRDRFRRAADPWDLDLEGIADALARGELTACDVDELPVSPVLIRAEGAYWFLESPLKEPVAARDGVAALPAVSLGEHGLYSSDGRFVLFQATEQGVVALPPISGPGAF